MGKFKLRKYALVFDKVLNQWATVRNKRGNKLELYYQKLGRKTVINYEEYLEVWG